MFHHDLGHVCRGKRIHISGHSDFGIVSNFGAPSTLTWVWAGTASAVCPPQPGSLAMTAYGLRALDRTRPTSKRTPWRSPFHQPEARWPLSQLFWRAPTLPAAPFQCRRSRAATLGPVATKTAGSLPFRRPDCTLSRLHTSKEYDRQVTQSIGTPEPGFCEPHPRSSRSSLRPWLCHPTLEPTVLSRMSCCPLPWIMTVFTSLACCQGTFRNIWGLSSPYHVATTYPCGQPSLPSLGLTRGNCHADWTVPRQDVNSPFLPWVCHPGRGSASTHWGSGPSRVRRRLLWTCLGDPIPLSTHCFRCCHLRRRRTFSKYSTRARVVFHNVTSECDSSLYTSENLVLTPLFWDDSCHLCSEMDFHFLCFQNSFLLFLWSRCHAGNVSSFFHSLSTTAFASGIFIAWSIGIDLRTKL